MDIIVLIIGIVIGFVAGCWFGMRVAHNTETVRVRTVHASWDEFADALDDDFDDDFWEDEEDEFDLELDSNGILTIDMETDWHLANIASNIRSIDTFYETVFAMGNPTTVIVYPKYTEQDLESWAAEQEAAYDELDEEMRVFGKI